jgi:hypothetical protein
MQRLLQVLALVAIVGTLGACAMTRTTTTDKTAIEIALLSQTAEEAIGSLEIPELKGKTYNLDTKNLDTPAQKFIVSELEERILESGARPFVPEDAKADLIIEPRANFAHIDDDKFLIGIPALPLPVPGAGTFTTPEIAFYGVETQKGRTRLSVFGKDPANNELAFASTTSSVEHRFRRYTFFLFFKWRATTLPEPF